MRTTNSGEVLVVFVPFFRDKERDNPVRLCSGLDSGPGRNMAAGRGGHSKRALQEECSREAHKVPEELAGHCFSKGRGRDAQASLLSLMGVEGLQC
jgi:hypothetical protein